MKQYCILDCYVDEPACFGVPPFLSPYPRYVYGALLDAGVPQDAISYLTIDALRTWQFTFHEHYDIVFCIGGATVPGKYLGFSIGTASEIATIITQNKDIHFAVGGMIAFMLNETTNTTMVTGDIEQFAYDYARNSSTNPTLYRTYHTLARWSVYGSRVVTFHPLYPNLICEIETYRGCPRRNHCSFCSEGLFTHIQFRETVDILNEVDSLIECGITRFRIGRQADIIAYKTQLKQFIQGFPKPEPNAVSELFNELKKRKDAGSITMLNIDNANPGTIFYFPKESSHIIQTIAQAVTPGDTMPLGVESFDPAVIAANKLKLQKDDILTVVKMINQIGGIKEQGIHRLLPGINLIHGLIAENINTFKINYQALHKIMDEGLLLKRINIRTLSPFPGTVAAQNQKPIHKTIENRYRYYREKIRKDIDTAMIKKLYPIGTIIHAMFVLSHVSDYSYAKEIRSYAITAKIPLRLSLNNFYTCIVVGYRERSVVCLPYPVSINLLPHKAIEAIPGIGKKLAAQIIFSRPYSSLSQLKPYIEHVSDVLVNAIDLRS